MPESSTIHQLLAALAESASGLDPPALRTIADRARRRRRIRVITAGTTALAMVVATVIIVHGTRNGPSRVTTGPIAPSGTMPKFAGGTAAELARGHWSELPPAPIPGRAGATTVWTGKEMVVWGGSSGVHGATLHGDGAAYNPRTQRWRTVPAAPLAAREQQSAVWTGHELIVWGGYDNASLSAFHVTRDGAAFDPDRQTWRKLAPSPLAARAGASAVWTGKEMIVVGGNPAVRTDAVRGFTDAAAYDPASDRWRVLPARPQIAGHDVEDAIPAWAGSRLLVWVRWSHTETNGNTTTGTAGIDLISYDPASNTWRQLPEGTNAPRGIEAPLWTGREVIVPAPRPWSGPFSTPAPFGLRGSRYDVARNAWRTMPHGPVDDTIGPTFWTGSALLRFSGSVAGVVQPGDGAAWDLTTDGWVALPRAPSAIGSSAVWTGQEVLFWSGRDPSAPDRSLGDGLRFGG